MNTLSKIKDMLLAARDIAVYCHTNPDGDTLACALALRRALAAKGKTVTVFCDDKVPERYAFFEGAESVSLPEKRTHELALAVDCSDLARVGGAGKSFLSAKRGQSSTTTNPTSHSATPTASGKTPRRVPKSSLSSCVTRICWTTASPRFSSEA